MCGDFLFLIGLFTVKGEVTLNQAFLLIASFALGVVAGWLPNYLIRWFMRPRLRILPDLPMRSQKAVDHVFVVKNEGRTAAKTCIATLSLNAQPEDLITHAAAELDEFEKSITGSPKAERKIKYHLTKENFRPVRNEKTCWADISNPVAITINPKLVSGLEIYRVLRPSLEMYFPTEGGWKHIRMVLRPKVYYGKLVVSAENSFPAEKYFKTVVEKDDVRLEFVSKREGKRQLNLLLGG